MKVSCVINLDSRNQNDTADSLFNGTVSWDYWVDGVLNKIRFLEGFDKEIILYGDVHNEIPIEILSKLQEMCDAVCLRKHTDERAFNDWNYHRALSLATGDVVIHVDQDTACFTSSPDYVKELIGYLDHYKFVCYPSHWTPDPVHDTSFNGLFWASTRFFICKRETLKLDELAKCIDNPDWMYETYGDSPRRCNWTEHYLAKINGNNVFYPPVQLHLGAIFSWGTYKTGTLKALNNLEYEFVKQWILHNNGIVYPCDIHVK